MLFTMMSSFLICSSKSYCAHHDFNKLIDAKMKINSTLPINNEASFLIEVSEQDNTNWSARNDGVMGGLSKGEMIFNHDHGIFTGNVSLANNGGFSSVYRTVENIADDIKTVIVDIEGDGQIYQLRLAQNVNGYRIAYKHDFFAQAGIREKIVFSLDNFRASYRGMIIDDAPPIFPDRLTEVGFLIANKRAGRFALAVHSILFVNVNSEQFIVSESKAIGSIDESSES